VRSAESAAAQNDKNAADHELAAWREEIRRHALAGLTRRPVKPPRILRIGALVFLLLVHAVLLMGLRDAMRRPPAAIETTVEVIFLNPDLPEPPLPEPPPSTPHPAAAAPRVTARVIAPAPSTPSVPVPADTAVAPLLFNTDGSIRLPAQSSPHMRTPQQLSAELMQRGHNILHCRQTRFANGYTRDESVGESVARKYLVWVGLYNREYAERKAAQRAADAAAACDG
jgi:hypothetical protein